MQTILSDAAIVRRPRTPEGLRIIRTELMAMEYLGTPHGRVVTDGWLMIVVAEPDKMSPAQREELKAGGWSHFRGRNAGTFRRKISIRFEG